MMVFWGRTWMSRCELGSKVSISGFLHLRINGRYWGYNPLTPPKINIEPENHGWKMMFLFHGCILRFHVTLPGCINQCYLDVPGRKFRKWLVSGFFHLHITYKWAYCNGYNPLILSLYQHFPTEPIQVAIYRYL